jgi:hypothetical protein
MPKICYVERRFAKSSLKVIEQANEIIAEYEAAGFTLTLRQLFYQFVSRDLIPNTQKSYKTLGSIINDARLAGLIDWHSMEDRTRNIVAWQTWDSPGEMIEYRARTYAVDRWNEQEHRVEVWIEKDALAGVFNGVCSELQVPYFSCRGYTSQSEMWSAGQRLKEYVDAGQTPVVLHFGDHDPSGQDMTRDITDRLEMFMGGIELKRLALNMDQIEEYEPPPNPAKTTDSRYAKYIELYGEESWELDALSPEVLAGLVRDAVAELRDEELWEEAMAEETEHKRLLAAVAEKWDTITRRL